MEVSSAAPGGATHSRPLRPRPSVWYAATATHTSGSPASSHSRTTRWVLSTARKCSIRFGKTMFRLPQDACAVHGWSNDDRTALEITVCRSLGHGCGDLVGNLAIVTQRQ